jgi:hypothetical protein
MTSGIGARRRVIALVALGSAARDRCLPAIEAGQITNWYTTHGYGYGNFAPILDDMTKAVTDASPDVVP